MKAITVHNYFLVLPAWVAYDKVQLHFIGFIRRDVFVLWNRWGDFWKSALEART